MSPHQRRQPPETPPETLVSVRAAATLKRTTEAAVRERIAARELAVRRYKGADFLVLEQVDAVFAAEGTAP